METRARALITPRVKLQNLHTSLTELTTELRKEGRYAAAEHVNIARASVSYALGRYGIQTPGHD